MIELCDHDLCRRIYVPKETVKIYNKEKSMRLEWIVSLETLSYSPIDAARILCGRPALYTELYKYLPNNFVCTGSTDELIEFCRFVAKYDLIDPQNRKRYFHFVMNMQEIDEDVIDYFYGGNSVDDIMKTYWKR